MLLQGYEEALDNSQKEIFVLRDGFAYFQAKYKVSLFLLVVVLYNSLWTGRSSVGRKLGQGGMGGGVANIILYI
jgi:hypothetical protein